MEQEDLLKVVWVAQSTRYRITGLRICIRRLVFLLHFYNGYDTL